MSRGGGEIVLQAEFPFLGSPESIYVFDDFVNTARFQDSSPSAICPPEHLQVPHRAFVKVVSPEGQLVKRFVVE